MAKEENAIILDFLPYGYVMEQKSMPIAQAIGTAGLTLLQLVPRRGEKFEIGEVAYIGDGKREKVQYILGRSVEQIFEYIGEHVGENDVEMFVGYPVSIFVGMYVAVALEVFVEQIGGILSVSLASHSVPLQSSKARSCMQPMHSISTWPAHPSI